MEVGSNSNVYGGVDWVAMGMSADASGNLTDPSVRIGRIMNRQRFIPLNFHVLSSGHACLHCKHSLHFAPASTAHTMCAERHQIPAGVDIQ